MNATPKLTPAMLRTLQALTPRGTYAARGYWGEGAPTVYADNKQVGSARSNTLQALVDRKLLTTRVASDFHCTRWTITPAGLAITLAG